MTARVTRAVSRQRRRCSQKLSDVWTTADELVGALVIGVRRQPNDDAGARRAPTEHNDKLDATTADAHSQRARQLRG